MISLLLAALAIAIGSLAIGQALLRLCGAARWSWLSPSAGIAVMMPIAATAPWIPGRALTAGLVIGVLALAGLAWCLPDRDHRPPAKGLATAAPLAGLLLLPFITNGSFSTLGVSFNNDMATHLMQAEVFASSDAERATPFPLQTYYPIGPHSLAGALIATLRVRGDLAFAGFTFALPILAGWTALHALRRPTWFGSMVISTVVGLPFLVASYYGEGAFKELLAAQLFLALALWLERPPDLGRRGFFVLPALLIAASMDVYSLAALPWPLTLLGLGTVVVAGRSLAHHRSLRPFARVAREHAVALALAAAIFLVALIPMLPRLKSFLEANDRFGLGDSLGNLVRPLPFWESLGVWNDRDFRFSSESGITSIETLFMLGLVVVGCMLLIRSKRANLLLGTGAAFAVWVIFTETQSPYVAAKALVVLSPILVLTAALPLAEHLRDEVGARRVLTYLLSAGLLLTVGASDVRALRYSRVGVTSHLEQLRSLRKQIDGRPTLFLGDDDFVGWELAGVPVIGPVIGYPIIPSPPEKPWVYGRGFDIDSVSADAINAVDWVITPRDPSQSTLPRQLQLMTRTDDFELWHRVGQVAPRQILAEGTESGAILDCTTRLGQHVLHRGGVAAIRPQPRVVAGAPIPAGQIVSVRLTLPPGRWFLGVDYFSQHPIEVRTADGGLVRKLPANLDRPGPRWPVGEVIVPAVGAVTLTFMTDLGPLALDLSAQVISIVATPPTPVRTVPLRAACGQYVDWYRENL